MLPLISIILPCYRPLDEWEKNVVHQYRKICTHFKGRYQFEVILVNDGSSLNTSAIESMLNQIALFKYISLPKNTGKGNALRKGALAATGQWTILTDIDFPYTTQNLYQAVEYLEKGADITWVVRNPAYYQSVPAFRKILSQLLQSIISFGFKMPYRDTQGGLKGLSGQGKKLLQDTQTPRYLYDLELIFLAFKNKLVLTPFAGELRKNISFPSIPFNILLAEFFSLLRLLKR